MAKRKAANGAGSAPRKVTRTDKKTGKTYTYWEGRITIGTDPGTGKQIQKSFTGKTEAEVRKKMTAALAEVDRGEYKEPSKLTVAAWMNEWLSEYTGNVKRSTHERYAEATRNHIIPALGATKVSALTTRQIQKFINSLCNVKTGEPLASATVQFVCTTLNSALKKAVECEIIRTNPAEGVELPKHKRSEVQVLDNEGMIKFLNSISGSEFENLFTVLLFTGMRRGEALGLTWDNVDFQKGMVKISQQLQCMPDTGNYEITTPKSGKSRTICPAEIAMQALKAEQIRQNKNRLKAGPAWDNPYNLVFTNALGRYVIPETVRRNFKKFAAQAGYEGSTVHDLRHTFAVNSLRSGDNAKSVSAALGHASTSFTLDVYASITEEMQRESAAKMNAFVESLKREKAAI